MHSKQRLQLLSDPDMYFIEKGIRGDISQISHRHAEVMEPDEHILMLTTFKDGLQYVTTTTSSRVPLVDICRNSKFQQHKKAWYRKHP